MGGERRVQRLLEVGIARGTSADSTVSPGEVSFNPVPLRAGSRIGRCRLEEPIGRGSHGTVWRAIHEGTGRLVAVKLLRRDLLEGQALSRFHHEARILGRIRHPGVAQVLDHGMASGEEGAHAYHVLEFVEGVPLHEYGPDLSWREKLSVFVRVCDAVQAVHECGVIHRDLAPGNVLIQRDGQPKVIDFGLARAERVEVPERPWETASGSLLGTIAFASPEQVSGERELVGMRSDVYSLGAILHLWLTGRTPIDVDAPLHERLRRVREDTPRPPSYWRPELRGDVDAIVARALEKRNEERYASADALARDLERAIKGERIHARRYSAARLALRVARRHLRTALLVVGSLMLVLAGLAWSLLGWEQARETKRTSSLVVDTLLSLASRLEAEGVPSAIREAKWREIEALVPHLEGETSLRTRSEVYERLGDVALDRGELALALPWYERAREVRIERVGLTPNDPLVVRELARSEVKLGDALAGRGLATRARELHDRAHRRILDLWDRTLDSQLLDDLVWDHERRGEARMQEGRPTEAFAEYLRMRELATALYEVHPELAGSLEALASSRRHVARMQLHLGRVSRDQYLTVSEGVLDLRRRAYRKHSKDPFRAMCVLYSILDTVEARRGLGLALDDLAREAEEVIDDCLRQHGELERLHSLIDTLTGAFGKTGFSPRSPMASNWKGKERLPATQAFHFSPSGTPMRTTSLLATILSLLPFSSPAQTSADWVPLPVPPRRSYGAGAYDASNGQFVLFGGWSSSGENLGDTWLWDGRIWTHVTPNTSPPAMNGHAMAYDAGRQRVVLFGGNVTGGPTGHRNATWEWDGMTWTERVLPSSPPPVANHKMVYDVAHEEIVMFGGISSAGLFDHTWGYDGTTWTEKPFPNRPPARQAHAMGYDHDLGQVIVFGGNGSGVPLGDTWRFDDLGWQNANPASSPSPGADHVLHADGQGLILFGGVSGNTVWNDTWRWDGTNATWNLVAPPERPAGRLAAASGFDATGNLIVFGGQLAGGSAPPQSDETWRWDGATWARVGAPAPRSYGGAAYDEARREYVLFGGWDGTDSLADTWLWRDGGWDRVEPAQAPPALNGHAMAYDASRGRVVLFGGNTPPGTHLNATWEWDGTNWIQRTFSTNPPPMRNHKMAFDRARGVIVLFGGIDDSQLFGETWTYDGMDWILQQPASQPAARQAFAMAYDESNEVTILFGGNKIGGQHGDTWCWTGSDWQSLSPTSAPASGADHILAWDGRDVILFGGATSSTVWNDTWRWDHATTNWELLNPATQPMGRLAAMAARDDRGDLVVFGGQLTATASPVIAGETWSYASPVSVDPVQSTVEASPNVVSAFGGEAAITVTLRDAQGQLVTDGLPVTVSATAGSPSSQLAIDNLDGTHAATLTATPGSSTATLTAEVDGVQLQNSVDVTFVPVDATHSEVTVTPHTTYLGGRSTVMVVLRDDQGAQLGSGFHVTVTPTMIDPGGLALDHGDGTYSIELVGNVTGTAEIQVEVDGMLLLHSPAWSVLDPAQTGDVIGLDAGGTAHGFSSIQDAVNAVTTSSLVHILVAPRATPYDEIVQVKDASQLVIEALSVISPVEVRGFKFVRCQQVTLAYFDVNAIGEDRACIRLAGGARKNTGISILGCVVRNAGAASDGVFVNPENEDVTITGCSVRDNGRNGIHLRKSGGPYRIAGCAIESNGFNGTRAGLEVEVWFEGNSFVGNGTATGNSGGRHGILRARDQGPGLPELITLVGNLFSGNQGKVRDGKSDADLGNYDQIIDPTDSQAPYVP